MNQQDLLDLKEKIDKAKAKVSELKGSQKHLMKELKDDWDCATIPAAEKKVEKIKDEIKQLTEKINQGVEELEEKYDVE